MAENVIRGLLFGRKVGSVLIVGEDNKGASAVMEYLLSVQQQASGMKISSAGIGGEGGAPLPQKIITYLQSIGMDARAFRTRVYSPRAAADYELLLATSMGVKGLLLFLNQGAAVYTLSEYALTGSDVGNLEGMNEAEFQSTMEMLNTMAQRIAARASKNKIF
ncbi:MAG: hypothetical protein QXP70_03150 [Methanomassiliicoccales archaeon]